MVMKTPPFQPVKPGRRCIEDSTEAPCVVRGDDQDEEDDHDPDHVPPHADVAEDLDEPDAERVEQAVGDEHQQEDT